MNYGVWCNVAVCLLIVLASIWYAVTIGKQIRKHSLGESHSFQLVALHLWICAWIAWCALFLFRLDSSQGWIGSDEASLFLSDCNSLFFLACFFVLSRGHSVTSDHTGGQIALAMGAVLAVAAVFAFLLCLLAHFFLGPEYRCVYLNFWSVALSVMAPVMLGRAFVKRFGTRSLWGVAIVYALFQPIAYGTRFFPEAHKRLEVCLPDRVLVDIQEKQRLVLSTSATPGIAPDVRRYTVTEFAKLSEDDMHTIASNATGPGSFVAWLRLRGSSVLFSVLAILKLVFAALFLQQIQRVAPGTESTVKEFGEEKWLDMDPEGRKWLFFSILACALLLGGLGILYHFDITLAAVYAGLTVFVGAVMRVAGGTLDDLLGRKRPAKSLDED